MILSFNLSLFYIDAASSLPSSLAHFARANPPFTARMRTRSLGPAGRAWFLSPKKVENPIDSWIKSWRRCRFVWKITCFSHLDCLYGRKSRKYKPGSRSHTNYFYVDTETLWMCLKQHFRSKVWARNRVSDINERLGFSCLQDWCCIITHQGLLGTFFWKVYIHQQHPTTGSNWHTAKVWDFKCLFFSVASQTSAASPATEKRLKSIEKPLSVCINRRCSLHFIADITVLMYAVSSDALMMSSNVNGKNTFSKSIKCLWRPTFCTRQRCVTASPGAAVKSPGR